MKLDTRVVVKCIYMYLPCSRCTFLDSELHVGSLTPLSRHHDKRNLTFVCTENRIYFLNIMYILTMF